jgi:hypothetical protein
MVSKMNTWKMAPRIQAILASMIVVGLAAFIRVVAALGSDGTPDPTFSIEPVSLLIGLAGGAIAVGVPVLARAASHRKVKGEQCDDGNTGSQAKAKEKKRPGRESPTLASTGKTSLRESPTKGSDIAATEIRESPTKASTGQTSVRESPTKASTGQTSVRESPSKPSTGQTKIDEGADAVSKPVDADGKTHTKTGHVTLMK